MTKARNIADIGSNDVLDTDANGVDVTGSITADDITLNDSSPTITLTDSDGPYTGVVRQNGSNTEIKNEASGNIRFFTGSDEEALRITGDKDIQILDGSGTAYGFFDASTQRLGLGTTTPDSLLELYKAGTSELMIGSDNAGTAQLSFYEGTSSTKEGFLKYDGASNNVVLGTSGAANALVVARDTGNVGIGNASPAAPIDIAITSNQGLLIDATSGNNAYLTITNNGSNSGAKIGFDNVSNATVIGHHTHGDIIYANSSGNVGIGGSPIAQSKLTVAGHSLSLTGSDQNFGAGGVRGMLDLASGYLRMGAVNGGGSASGVKLIAPAGQEALVMDSSGRVTTPYQPYVFVEKNAEQTLSSNENPITFEVSRYNSGNHFNLSANSFTAPVTGRYAVDFVATCTINANHLYNAIFINYNGTEYQGVRSRVTPNVSSANEWSSFVMSAVIYMAANDSFTLRGYSNHPSNGPTLSSGETNLMITLLG